MRRRRRSMMPALVALTILSACGREPTGSMGTGPGASLVRETEALFQTDSLAYVVTADDAGFSGQVGVRFTNRTGGTVYFVNCNGATGHSLEKLIDGEWRAVWSPVLPACLSAPITVPVGGTYDASVEVHAGVRGGNLWPQFTVDDVAGVYRIVWHSALSSYSPDRYPFGEALPPGQRVSNRFTISVRRR